MGFSLKKFFEEVTKSATTQINESIDRPDNQQADSVDNDSELSKMSLTDDEKLEKEFEEKYKKRTNQEYIPIDELPESDENNEEFADKESLEDKILDKIDAERENGEEEDVEIFDEIMNDNTTESEELRAVIRERVIEEETQSAAETISEIKQLIREKYHYPRKEWLKMSNKDRQNVFSKIKKEVEAMKNVINKEKNINISDRTKNATVDSGFKHMPSVAGVYYDKRAHSLDARTADEGIQKEIADSYAPKKKKVKKEVKEKILAKRQTTKKSKEQVEA